jgi:SAM-dependent methyltransferase
MNNERVIWVLPPMHTIEACFVCGNINHNQIILKAKHWHADLGMLEVATCGKCKSAWFIDSLKHNLPYPSTEAVLLDPNFIYLIYHYLEIVAGLDWKISLLEQLPFSNFKSVLEVGCNAGVTLDYCRTMWNVNTVGLEPSAYGVIGSQLLNLPIIHKYMNDAVEIRNKTFDFIFATEVLEHVPDPLSFLIELKNYLAEDGICLITTPNSNSLNKLTPPGELCAALSPGAHYFLLSSRKLEELARQVGFSFCQIEPFGMTNVAVLSNKPISLAAVKTSDRLLAYYQKKVKLRNADKRTRLCYLINCYINEKIHLPDLNAEIQQLLMDLFDININDPRPLINRMSKTSHLVDFGKVMPYSLPFYLYVYANNLKKKGEPSDSYLCLARAIVTHGMKVDFQNLFVYHELYRKIPEDLVLSDGANKVLFEFFNENIKVIPKIPKNSNGYLYKVRKLFRILLNGGHNGF